MLNSRNWFVLIIVCNIVALLSIALLVLPNRRNNNNYCSSKNMLTKLSLAFFGLFVLLAILLASFLTVLNTKEDLNNILPLNQTLIDSDSIRIDDKSNDLFWFIHLSDTHLSHFQDKNRSSDLKEFCRRIIPMIKPPLLVLTGDIVDARTRFPLGSDQYKQEWLMYSDTLKRCKSFNPDLTWIDIRGNHDSFNSHKTYNYFFNHTVQHKIAKNPVSYRYEMKTKDGNRYSFIGVDSCLKPGIRRPFNFVGRLDQSEIDRLEIFKKKSAHTNYTVWFGHYPTSSIYNNEAFRNIINGPYLCGHYHTVQGAIPNMISTQRQGYLEAESGDWKDSRIFRIAVIDHQLFTFANYHYRPNQEQPLIVITNPRSVLHQMEHLEPFWRTAKSTHIRALIFSSKSNLEAKAYIHKNEKFSKDDILKSFNLNNTHGDNLWVAKWSPKEWAKGLYYMTVIASDDHHTNQITVPFSLDQTKPEYSFWGRTVLRIDFKTQNMFLYSWTLFASVVPLLTLRFFTSYDDYQIKHLYNLSRRRYIRKVLFRLYLVAHQNKLFYLLLFIPVYIMIGPWFIGHLYDDKVGIVFIWGQFIQDTYLPVGFTYIFAALFTLIFHLPFVMCLSILVNIRYSDLKTQIDNRSMELNGSECLIEEKRKISWISFINETNCCVCSLCVIVFLQLLAAGVFYAAYGWLAFITHVFVWSNGIYIWMILIALKLNEKDLRIGSYQSSPLSKPVNSSKVQSTPVKTVAPHSRVTKK